MSTILDYNFAAVPDLAVAEPAEYRVKVTKVSEITDSKSSDAKYITATLNIEGQKSLPIFHRLFLPDGVDKDKDESKLRMMKTFLEAFGLSTAGKVNLDQLVGKMAWALVGIESSEGYPDKNNIKKFIKKA
jgi:hypothetical protein